MYLWGHRGVDLECFEGLRRQSLADDLCPRVAVIEGENYIPVALSPGRLHARDVHLVSCPDLLQHTHIPVEHCLSYPLVRH